VPIRRQNLIGQEADELAESGLMRERNQKPMLRARVVLDCFRAVAVDDYRFSATVSRAVQVGLKGLIGVIGYDFNFEETRLRRHKVWSVLH